MSRQRRQPQRGFLEVLGKEVKSSRIACGLTQMKLAEKAKVTYRHLQEIEYGKVDVRVLTLYKLKKIFSKHGFRFTPLWGLEDG